MVLSRTVAAQGHLVVEAHEGKQALELLRQGHDPPFDVVLLDLLMPDVDGYQVLERIQNDDGAPRVAVIVVSAMDDSAIAMQCVELGAADYLPKPVNPALLKARLGAAIAERRLGELERHLDLIARAATGLADGTVTQDSLDPVAARDDAAGRIARAVQHIAALLSDDRQRVGSRNP